MSPIEHTSPPATPKVEPRKPRTCTLCCTNWDGEIADQFFPHNCHRCSSENASFCMDCLRDWFLDACKNESKMPPRCCTIIPLATVSHLLTEEQVSLSFHIVLVMLLILHRAICISSSLKNGVHPIGYTAQFPHARLSFRNDCTIYRLSYSFRFLSRLFQNHPFPK